MMSVLEYAQDMNKSVEEIIKMCGKLGIDAEKSDDMLSDDSIVELDNAFSNEPEEESVVDEEIIKKMDEDDYYDEAIDTLIDKKDAVYNSEPKRVK